MKRLAKRQQPERALQVRLKGHLDRNCRSTDAIYYAVPNGGHRHALEAVNLKAQGVRAGVPDLVFILRGGRHAGLELKAEKGRLSDQQMAFKVQAEQLGALWAVAHSFDEAIEILTGWGVLGGAR